MKNVVLTGKMIKTFNFYMRKKVILNEFFQLK